MWSTDNSKINEGTGAEMYGYDTAFRNTPQYSQQKCNSSDMCG
jgi:hypothetical protein